MKKMSFKADLSEDMQNFLNINFNMESINDKIDETSIINSFNFIS